MDSRSVCFVCPELAVPSGGIRVILHYATALSRRGCEVTVVTPSGRVPSWLGDVPDKAIRYTSSQGDLPAAKDVPICDIAIATIWYTAYACAGSANASAKFHLVQLDETCWLRDTNRQILNHMMGAYRLPLRKIAVSKHLADWLARDYGQEAIYVPNGIDTQLFRPRDRHIKPGDPLRIGTLWSSDPTKGSRDALAAMRIAADSMTCKLIAFGVGPEPEDSPFDEYYQQPPQIHLSEVYASLDAFVYASYCEGMTLVPMEAMACGAPLVLTDIEGVQEYAVHGDTALLSQPGDVDALGRNLVTVLRDTSFSAKLTASALEKMREFTWERSCQAFLEALGIESQPTVSVGNQQHD